MLQYAKWFFGVLFAAFMLGAFAGCAMPKTSEEADLQKQHIENTLTALKGAQFKGNIVMESGGSPLSVGTKTVFFLGAENSKVAINGEVDFTKTPPDDGG